MSPTIITPSTPRSIAQSQGQRSTTTSSSSRRLRAACDECRVKKLKCTGEQPACSRCVREGVACAYSPQKRMGRPKKRARMDDDGIVDAPEGVRDEEDGGRRREEGGGGGAVEEGDLMAGLDAAFTPGGHLQPWLQGGLEAWDFGAMGSGAEARDGDSGNAIPTETQIPSLTPDSSSNSPPTLNLPPELQRSHSHNHLHDIPTPTFLDPHLSSTNDSLSDTNLNNPLPSCACLSTIYLTLSTLQQPPPSPMFPLALAPLREAMQTASTVLTCASCPTRFISAVQNTQLLGTLIITIAERFGKVLAAISSESVRAEAAGEGKKFRLADLEAKTADGHSHTGGLGCAAAFDVELAAGEWRSLAKKVVRAEVHGPLGGGDGMRDCCPVFVGVIDRMEERQRGWHCKPMSSDFPVDKDGRPLGGPDLKKEEHVCFKLCLYARKLVEGFDWS